MRLNSCIFIDIETCLVKTKSGKERPLSLTDWQFNDVIIEYIRNHSFDFVCLIADRPVSEITNKRGYEKYITLIQDQLSKIVVPPIKVIYYNIKDDYFNYPYPGGVYNFAIENDANLHSSIYISDNQKACNISSIGCTYSLSEILLHG